MSEDIIYIIKHADEEGPGILGDCLTGLGRETIEIDLHKGQTFPEDLRSVAGLIVLGGPMNVYQEDDYPFLKEEGRFIKSALVADIPFLGICLGAQLLAKACGAPITKAPVPEAGWSKVQLTDAGQSDVLLYGLPRELPVFQWHGDTFALPEGGVLLATSQKCVHQAFSPPTTGPVPWSLRGPSC